MTGGSGSGSLVPSPAPAPPKILLAKPGLVTGGPSAGKFGRGSGSGADEEAASLRTRLPSVNLLSDSWDFHIDRFLPFLTENTDFTVVGVIGPPGVGKSTIMNELYGFDSTSPGMLPSFSIQSEDMRAMAKHCTAGIEPRVSADRIILLDTQPVFSPSILTEMIKPDGSSSIPVLGGESLSAELAHELMAIQIGVLLSSICHILLVVSEGVHDSSMWHLMSKVDMLKHGLPDPSSHVYSQVQGTALVSENDGVSGIEEYMATPVFVHMKLQDQEMNPCYFDKIREALSRTFSLSSFTREKGGKKENFPASDDDNKSETPQVNLFVVPLRNKDDTSGYESSVSALWKLRDQVISMNGPSFSRTVSERDWLRNTAKIWELVKSSPVMADYCRMLQNMGIFRR